MKTLIRNFIAVMAFMILGHFAVVAQVTTQVGDLFITTVDESDTVKTSILIEASTGRMLVGFMGADSSFKSGTMKVRFNCFDEIVDLDYTPAGHYREGVLLIEITASAQEIQKYLLDNADILSVTSSSGKTLKAEMPNTSDVVYKVVNGICPECGFTKPSCDTKRL